MVVGLTVGSASVQANGGQRCVVRRDGSRVFLDRSTTEFAIAFRKGEDIAAASKRIVGTSQTTIESFHGGHTSRIKLLRMGKGAAMRKASLRQDPAIEDVRPIYRFNGSSTPVASTGQINVRLHRGLSDAERAKLWSDYRVGEIFEFEGLPNVFCVKPIDGDDEDEVLRAEAMALDARTVWAEPNFRIPSIALQLAPADTFFGQQWHLNNTGQSGGISGSDIKALDAWSVSQGSDVLFGIFDDAVDVDHEDLRSRYKGIGNDPGVETNDPGSDDPRPKGLGDRHGTAVMGLAVASANTVGVRGVSFLSTFTASRGLSDLLSTAQIARAFTFARQQKVDVHINSWGLGSNVPDPILLTDAIQTAFLEGRDLDGPLPGGPKPARGMVVVFASGNGSPQNNGPNIGTENRPGFALSSLPTVIGVGASTASDDRSTFSNFGPEIDLLAPGGGLDGLLATTDNTDGTGLSNEGFNIGGFAPDGSFQELDMAGKYTGAFAGTSAACPIVAGVAGLILSANPNLTATDVRLILEHTSDKVSPASANYNSITSRSLRFGYGRVNAKAAADVAKVSINNGNRSWPGRPADVTAADNQIRWLQNGDTIEFPDPNIVVDDTMPPPPILRTTDEFLVVESDTPMTFGSSEFPKDSSCYSLSQRGCSNGLTIEPLPAGVRILAVGCALACTGGASTCEAGAEQCVEFLQPQGEKFFGIYARSSIGRYSFGVSADSFGIVKDSGVLPITTAGIAGGGVAGQRPTSAPKVTISVTPTVGESPLAVQFTGNAASDITIDETQTAWDFDIDDNIAIDATSRNAVHTYEVIPGQEKTFIARLSMFDTDGNVGTAQVAIRVQGPGGGIGGINQTSARVIVGIPGTIGSDIDSGVSPFSIVLSVGGVTNVQSILWDLGDGNTASTLFVPHTYTNESTQEIRLPVSAAVSLTTSAGVVQTIELSRTISILPGLGITETPVVPPCDGCGAVQNPNGSIIPMCGAMSMIPALFLLVSMVGWRVRRRQD